MEDHCLLIPETFLHSRFFKEKEENQTANYIPLYHEDKFPKRKKKKFRKLHNKNVSRWAGLKVVSPSG